MNPRLVRMFGNAWGLKLGGPTLDLFAGENRKPPYSDKNPLGQTPMLELDDGTCLAETAAICGYLEELNPNPPLIGATPKDRAVTRMWWRRVELNICGPMIHTVYYKEGYDLFKDRNYCIPEAPDGLKTKAQKQLQWLDGELGDRP